MKSRFLLLVTLLAACAPVARPRTAQPGPDEAVVGAPLEAIWWAIVDVVGEYDLDLETMDLGRGFLRSRRSRFSDTAAGFWSCTPDAREPVEGVVSIYAVPEGNGSTRLRVSAVPVTDDGRFCQSNGVLEEQVTRRVAERWKELKSEIR